MEGDILRILYTGFKGKNNSSYQLLSKVSGEKIFLTNSFEGLTLFFKAVADTIEPLTDSDRINVFVVDDSLFERTSCKKTNLDQKYLISLPCAIPRATV